MNHTDQVQAKMNAQRDYAKQSECRPAATGDFYSGPARAGYEPHTPVDLNCLNNAGRVPIRGRILDEMRTMENNYAKKSRIIQILEKHPEFELFLDLQDLIKGLHNVY